MNKKQNILVGAVLAAGLVSTMTTLLMPKSDGYRHTKADAADDRKNKHKNLVLGGLAGGLLGVATSLLLAPQAGVELIKDLLEHEKIKKEKTSTKPKKNSKNHKAHGPTLKTSTNKTRKRSAVKKAKSLPKEIKEEKAEKEA